MFVGFWKILIMEGENTVKKRDSFWSRPKEVKL